MFKGPQGIQFAGKAAAASAVASAVSATAAAFAGAPASAVAASATSAATAAADKTKMCASSLILSKGLPSGSTVLQAPN